jgi:TonB family protein
MESIIKISNPCPENWDKMKIGVHSRFCENCQKNVIDFTGKTRNEIIEYFLLNYNKKTCGRFYESQLDFSHSDFLVTINTLEKEHKNSNYSFLLLTIGSLLLASCESPVNKKQVSVKPVTYIPDLAILTENSNPPPPEKKETPLSKKTDCELSPVHPQFSSIIMGKLDLNIGEIQIDAVESYESVEILPEFGGGLSGLMFYMKLNLIYPEWEKKNKIQGTVYTNFVIDKEGKIRDIKITKSVAGSKNFDKEVIRILSNMPNWKPGQNNGQNVDVLYNLPIRFEL